MRHLTEKELEIMDKMDKFDENSEEYKELQKQLIKISEDSSDGTGILY